MQSIIVPLELSETNYVCPICGNSFIPYRYWQKYCCPKHRALAWIRKNPEKHKANSLKWRRKNLAESRRINLKASTKWKNRNPTKVQARVQAKDIPLGDYCESCGSTERLVKHHPDYSVPLEIVTLCRLCHRKVHKKVQRGVEA